MFPTSEDEVKKGQPRFETVDALGKRFMELAQDDLVTWNDHSRPGFSFPDKKTFSEVLSAAKRAGIRLRPDRSTWQVDLQQGQRLRMDAFGHHFEIEGITGTFFVTGVGKKAEFDRICDSLFPR